MMIDPNTVDVYRARGRLGEDLGRQALCLKGKAPPPEQGVHWAKQKSDGKALFLDDKLEAKLRELGCIKQPGVLWSETPPR